MPPITAEPITGEKVRSAYNWRNLLSQSPEKVKVTLLAVGGVICGLLRLDPTLLETVGIGIAVERVLDLLYVAPANVVKREEEALRAIDLGKQLATAEVEEPADWFDTEEAVA